VADPVQPTSAGVRWEIAPGALGPREVALLLGPGGLRLNEWLASGAARVLKRASHRSLYRVVLPGLDVHVKHYPAGGRRGWLRSLVRPSAARLEYERTRQVADRGVPTVEPLAVGESRGGGAHASWLITRTFEGAVPLDAFLQDTPDGPPAPLRIRLARALGRLLARLHDAGLRHHDLHPGNILLRLDKDGELELFLLDLLMARLGPPLAWPAARDNLVVLNRWFHLRSHRSDRLRFWRAYRLARVAGVPAGRQAHELARDLERRTLRSNLRFWRRHEGRCLGGNRHFRRFRRGEFAGYTVADVDDNALTPLLDDPGAAFRRPGARVLKRSQSSAVAEVLLAGPKGPRRVICKRFDRRRALDPLAALVRPTQALRSYVMGHALRLRCLPTPRPLAVWHRRRGGLPCEGYLLTERVPDAVDLRAFLDRLGRAGAAERRSRLRRLIDQLARLVGRLHERHLSHRDLKAANLLVSPAPAVVTGRGIAPLPPEAPAGPAADQVWFIDLVGVRRLRKVRRRRRVLDLARLHASFHDDPGLTRSDRLRFLRVYLRWGLRGRHGWKRWWGQVAQATQAKVERHRREGRPLA
jgi:tRNA A-37 threonylcarbamoyl transferase component Bud32